jgi:hypothetical protein
MGWMESTLIELGEIALPEAMSAALSIPTSHVYPSNSLYSINGPWCFQNAWIRSEKPHRE